jgi:hypothetical protein
LKSGGSYNNGDRIFAYAEVTIHNALRCDGPFIQITETGTPSTAYIGFNKAGATTGFISSTAGRFYMVTPVFTIPTTNVSLKPEVICQAETLTLPGIVDLTIHSMGVVKL